MAEEQGRRRGRKPGPAKRPHDISYVKYILLARARGSSFGSIAANLGVSRQAVHQIYQRWHGTNLSGLKS